MNQYLLVIEVLEGVWWHVRAFRLSVPPSEVEGIWMADRERRARTDPPWIDLHFASGKKESTNGQTNARNTPPLNEILKTFLASHILDQTDFEAIHDEGCCSFLSCRRCGRILSGEEHMHDASSKRSSGGANLPV